VAFRSCILPDFFDFSVRANQAGTADNPQKILSQKTFHAARAVGFDHFEIRVAEEREVELVFGFEFGQDVLGIRAAAQDDGIELVELRLGVAKLGRFVRSTGCESLGVEKQHHVPPMKLGEGNFRAVVRGQAEGRRFVTCF
jgi:hypothetical protein